MAQSTCRDAFEKWQKENKNWASEKDYNMFAVGWLACQDFSKIYDDSNRSTSRIGSMHDWPVT